MTSEPDKPPQEKKQNKTFMDLPPEIRLMVYGFLLTDQPQIEKNHCCRKDEYRKLEKKHCDCNGAILHPQILSVNKLIFDEAMPILYANLEPYTLFSERDSDERRLSNGEMVPKLPDYSTKHIKSVVVCGFIMPFGHVPYMQEDITAFCKSIWVSYPNVNRIRIHRDGGLGQPIRELIPSWYWDCAWQHCLVALQGMLQFPKIRYIHTDYHVDSDRRGNTEASLALMECVLRKEAECLRKNIEISHELVDIEEVES